MSSTRQQQHTAAAHGSSPDHLSTLLTSLTIYSAPYLYHTGEKWTTQREPPEPQDSGLSGPTRRDSSSSLARIAASSSLSFSICENKQQTTTKDKWVGGVSKTKSFRCSRKGEKDAAGGEGGSPWPGKL